LGPVFFFGKEIKSPRQRKKISPKKEEKICKYQIPAKTSPHLKKKKNGEKKKEKNFGWGKRKFLKKKFLKRKTAFWEKKKKKKRRKIFFNYKTQKWEVKNPCPRKGVPPPKKKKKLFKFR